jgi:hypothetical protein
MLVIRIVAAVMLLSVTLTLEVCTAWAIDVGGRKMFGHARPSRGKRPFRAGSDNAMPGRSVH